jgi:oxygen-dependent protoporphyrinogen oxidase
VASDPNYDESVASFATRRLGRETFERLVQPLIAGIFVADAHRLSLAATFPEFLEAEREHGSLWRSLRTSPAAGAEPLFEPEPQSRRQAAGARYGKFVTLRRGMRALVEALADSLPDDAIQLATPVTSIVRSDQGPWRLTTASAATPEHFDGVILATPAPPAALLAKQFDPQLSGLLQRIDYASSAVLTLVYPRERIAHPMNGFGAVVPAIENRPIIAASFLTVKFPHTAPKERAVIRVFLGGVLHPEMIDRGDEKLLAIARQELADLLGAQGEPIVTHVARWRESMPQYHVGHLELVAAIETRIAAHVGLELAGNGYRGVGIPQCVRSGRTAAERLAAQLQTEGQIAR